MTTSATDLSIPAADGYALAATLHEPAPDAATLPGPVTVVGSAAAVRRRFYDLFARSLAESGRTVVTFDYRGIGGSRPDRLRGFAAGMRDWGTKDIAGVLAWTAERYESRAIHFVGHSFGGFGIGLAHNNHLVSRHLGIATPYTYWGLMDAPEKYRVGLLMTAAVPLFVPLAGRLPGRFIGGEDLPPGIALEWARWIRNKEMFFTDPTLPERAHFAHFTAPTCFMRFTDDPWSTERGITQLAKRFTHAASTRIVNVSPADIGERHIGHFGFFKPRLAPALWPRALAWLDGAEGAPGVEGAAAASNTDRAAGRTS